VSLIVLLGLFFEQGMIVELGTSHTTPLPDRPVVIMSRGLKPASMVSTRTTVKIDSLGCNTGFFERARVESLSIRVAIVSLSNMPADECTVNTFQAQIFSL